MIIQQTGLLDLLNAQVQYRIPIYQRKYDWSDKECIKFLSDIIDIARDDQRDQHFVGSIIYKSEQGVATVGAVNVNFLIDGQQRLTTLMLILWATGHYAKETLDASEYKDSDYSLDAIKDDYLTNNKRHIRTDKYYRLKPIGNDEVAYRALMNDSSLPANIESSRIFDNYNVILSYLRRANVSPDEVFTGIRKLVIANISLEARDNAQLLFETVNSTGKTLKEADKVRNFILMNAGETLQQQLFDNNWQPMEQRLNVSTDGGTTLDGFLFYYAGIKSEDKMPEKYYDVFKDLYLGINEHGIQHIIEDMDAYSVLFKRWLDSNALSTGTDQYIYRLKLTNNDKCIPVVLKVLRNVDLELMSTNDANEVLALLETYIIRREMYGLKSNAIGEAFVKILRSADSLHNIKRCIISDLTEKQRMPKDNELKTMLKTSDFYGIKHSHEILDRIEKHLNPAYMPNHNAVSIEHIMPQTIESSEELFARTDYTDQEKLDRDWATDLGTNWKEIHEKYCNTLGNLTLTGYNSRLSNCRFVVKRDMNDTADDGVIYGYSASAIHLSHGLRNLDQWGEEEILNRLENIFTYIQTLWPYPVIPDAELNMGAYTTIYDDAASREEVANNLFSTPDYLELRRHRLYQNTNINEADMLVSSKMYPKGNEEQFWFAYRENTFATLESCEEKYYVFVCRSNTLTAIKLSIDFLNSLRERFNSTTDENGIISHYHIVLRKNLNGQFYLLLSTPNERRDISNYIVPL